MDGERIAWIRRWAEGWRGVLRDREIEFYYEDLALSVAVDFILELLAESENGHD